MEAIEFIERTGGSGDEDQTGGSRYYMARRHMIVVNCLLLIIQSNFIHHIDNVEEGGFRREGGYS